MGSLCRYKVAVFVRIAVNVVVRLHLHMPNATRLKKVLRKLNLNVRWKPLLLGATGQPDETILLPYTTQYAEQISTISEYTVDIIDIPCPFLMTDKNGKTKCACYDVRPEICRQFGTLGHLSKNFLCDKYSARTI